MIRPILTLGDPRLWQPARAADPLQVAELAQDLADTLADFRAREGFGRGIAAPQIGVPLRVLHVLGHTLVNPRLVWASEQRFVLWDDCFSLPGLWVQVQRSCAVELAYQNLDGAPQRWRAEDPATAELLQHELDHLDGVLATDRALHPRALSMHRP